MLIKNETILKMCMGIIKYRDHSILHDGFSASYDHADDLLRDLGRHIRTLRAPTLSFLQLHQFLEIGPSKVIVIVIWLKCCYIYHIGILYHHGTHTKKAIKIFEASN